MSNYPTLPIIWDLIKQGKLYDAFWTFVPNFSDITYPGTEILQDGTVLKGELAYHEMCRKYRVEYGSENKIQAWKNVLWRQVGHATSMGAILGAQLGVYALLPYFFGIVAFFASQCAVTYFISKKEFVEDPKGDGEFFFKNIIDWSIQTIPGWVVLHSLLS